MPIEPERLETPAGEILIRPYEDRDIAAQATYLFESPKDFLESIGFAPSKLHSRTDWERGILQRRAEAEARGEPPRVMVAELRGRTISMVFLDQRHPDGAPRLHFHIFEPSLRGKGLGALILPAGIRAFSRLHGIQRFLIEPKASNARMNNLMKKLGFRHRCDHLMKEGPLTQEMIVSQYEISLADS